MNKDHSLPRKKIGALDYSLDVLTDGSEHTGHGTVFLTISRKPTTLHNVTPPLEKEEDRDNIMARYAIAGLSSMTARLCADQKLSLAKVRAVTCPTYSSCTGLASLLLALSSAGQDTLTVVGGKGVASYAETVASIILRNRAYPRVATCEVPQHEHPRQWWKIYQDEYLIVHGSTVSGTSTTARDAKKDAELDTSDIVLLYTLLRHSERTEESLFSFCVMPPGHSTLSNIVRPLPLELENMTQKSAPLKFILCVGLSGPVCRKSSISDHVLVTSPCHNEWDTGLLIRASSQVQLLHRALPFAFPVASIFDNDNNHIMCTTDHRKNDKVESHMHDHTLIRLKSCTSVMLPGHSSGTGHPKDSSPSGMDDDCEIPFRIVSRQKHIWDKCNERATMSSGMEKIKCSISTQDWNHLRSLYSAGTLDAISTKALDTVCPDENEIDLDEDDPVDNDQSNVPLTQNYDADEIVLEEDEEDNSVSAQPDLLSANPRETGESYFDPGKPHLMVLGTGCASPSPSRGASGYALLLPTLTRQTDTLLYEQDFTLTAIMECGEGTLTNLFRHLPGPSMLNSSTKQNEKLQQIRFVWISHAHLDHYGGLPCLVRAVHSAGRRIPYCKCGEQEHKNRKRKLDVLNNENCKCKLPLVVIAPSNVLRFLDASLNCKHGKVPLTTKNPKEFTSWGRDNYVRLFHGVTHGEFEGSPFASEVRDIVFNTKILRHGGTPNHPQEFRPFALLRSIPVEHCPQAHGLVLGLNFKNTSVIDNPLDGRTFSPFLLCFSGDTRPSPRLVRACQEIRSQCRPPVRIAFLMHESTFDDETRGKNEAIKKRHSTVCEALDIAGQIQADATLLTHFSQRYPRAPPRRILKEEKEDQAYISWQQKEKENFCFASDGLLIPLSRVPLSFLWLVSSSILRVIEQTQELMT